MLHNKRFFNSIYGPVKSWRFGQSLGIDPIGAVSTCSFNCVYCQIGEIECQTTTRQVFISTEQIQQDLQPFAPWDVEIVTVSGSGEPTLAQNLADILTVAKTITAKPVAVLTNGSLLSDPNVRAELTIADRVAVKLDVIAPNSFQHINRPLEDLELGQLWAGLWQFRQQYSGILSIQTMVLSAWSDQQQADYITLMQRLLPDEIQLNTPTRPKPTRHELDARGNHTPGSRPYLVRSLKPVSVEQLQIFRDRIQAAIGIPTRYPQHQLIPSTQA